MADRRAGGQAGTVEVPGLGAGRVALKSCSVQRSLWRKERDRGEKAPWEGVGHI